MFASTDGLWGLLSLRPSPIAFTLLTAGPQYSIPLWLLKHQSDTNRPTYSHAETGSPFISAPCSLLTPDREVPLFLLLHPIQPLATTLHDELSFRNLTQLVSSWMRILTNASLFLVNHQLKYRLHSSCKSLQTRYRRATQISQPCS